MQMEALAMTGAKLREAMDLLRSLKQKYPEDSDELLQQRFRKELERQMRPHPIRRHGAPMALAFKTALNLTFACEARPCCVSSARSPPQPPERRVRALPQLEPPAYRAVCAS